MTSQPAETFLCPVTIGRARELVAIRQYLECAAGGVFLVSGEAGVGKTRLVREAGAHAAGLGYRVLQGTCFEPDRSLPYAPILDLLRTFADHQPLDDIARLAGPAASDLAWLVPGLAGPATDDGVRRSDAEAEKRRLFEAFVRLLRGLGSDRPLLMVVEDLHWSDDISLEVLLYLARRIGDRPILLLLSYRGEEVQPSLRHTLAELDRGRLASELVLHPLTIDEAHQMVRAILDQQGPVRADVLDAVYTLTEGNPFFIEEVLRSLSGGGHLFQLRSTWARRDLIELHIPRSVQDAVQRRVERVSPAARHVLTMAAITGRRFDFPVLREVTGRDERELLPSIKELIAAQLVVQESGEHFAFRHALTRQAVYVDLLAIERKALHRAVAEAMERVYADAPEVHAGDLAYHFDEAGIWTKALPYARCAGEQAMALYAPQAAVEHFTRALHAAGNLPGAPPLDLYRSRGLAFDILGDFERAREDLEQSLELAQAAADQRAKWQSLLDLGMLWASRDYARTGEFYRRALDLARAMNDPAILARSLNRLGNWHVNIEQPQEGRHYHEEALTIFEELADRQGIAETLDLLGMARCCSGDLRGSMATYDRAASLFRELDDRHGLVMSLALLGARAGEYHFNPLVPDPTELARAVAAGEEALAIARAIQWRAGEAFAGAQLSQCLGTWGEYNRALAVAREADRLASEIEHRQWKAFTNQALGWVYLDLLALPTARHHFEHALQLARATNSLIWNYTATGGLASTCVQQGDLRQAEAILASIPSPIKIPSTFGQWSVTRAQVELALACRQPQRALDLLDRLVAARDPAGNGDQRPIGPPHLGRLRGEALAALERVAEAEAVLQLDLAAASERGCLPHQWRLHVALGRLYLADRRRAAADREFAAARSIVDELAARVPDDALRTTFLRLALAMLPPPRPPTTLRVAKQAFGGLTRREREVAVLIAGNQTNREIARALFIGERTIASHVSHILAKLNLASRTEIAAWARERGLTPPR